MIRLILSAWLALSCFQSPASAQGALSNGENGAAQSYTPAEMKSKCDSGNMIACDNLGIRYLKGDGVAKDAKQAASLFKRACDGGDAIGCHDLAESHRFGDGVAKDIPLAASLYQRGCDGGYASACAELALLYNDGDGVKQDDAKAALYADRACDRDTPLGCLMYGTVLAQGAPGYPKDEKRAAEILTQVCLGGVAILDGTPDKYAKVACPAVTKLTGKPACGGIVHAGEKKWRRCYDEKTGLKRVEVTDPTSTGDAEKPTAATSAVDRTSADSSLAGC